MGALKLDTFAVEDSEGCLERHPTIRGEEDWGGTLKERRKTSKKKSKLFTSKAGPGGG